jgi:membrane associated rhomboid family serine protease
MPTSEEARVALMSELRRDVRIIGGMLALLWLILILNVLFFRGQLNIFGIQPRSIVGLRGMLFAPFLHAGFFHLLGNSFGLAMLGGLVLMRQEAHFWTVTVLGALIAGAGTWLIGHPGVHIGASSVVFAYFGYLITTGLFERRLTSIALSVMAMLLWGSMILGVLPGQLGISWEGHLFGLVGGASAAWLIAKRRRVAA